LDRVKRKYSVAPPVYFYSGYFGDGVSQTICLGYPQTVILPISASQVARITGVSYQCPAALLMFPCAYFQIVPCPLTSLFIYTIKSCFAKKYVLFL
jgi:hypothetical protein